MKSVFTKEYECAVAALTIARKNAGLTQKQLAARLRKPQSFVSKYERRERRLDVVEFVRVAQTIGVDPSEIISALQLDMSGRPHRERRKDGK